MCSCGFCLLNNVAIGAAYAVQKYGPLYHSGSQRSLQKVAIIDFDIHHGNGTEEIIRNLVPHKENYPLPSSWEPMTYSSYKPWRHVDDKESVFFGSVHLFDRDEFYPGSGFGPHGDSIELRDSPNIVNVALKVIGPKFADMRSKLNSKSRKAYIKEASNTFRRLVRARLLEALRSFCPDIIFVSAGFDGHADDFYYFLTEEDYSWITKELKQIAESCCNGRLVSVLEGGYNVDPVGVKRQSTEYQYGSLARSCASHVEALMEPV